MTKASFYFILKYECPKSQSKWVWISICAYLVAGFSVLWDDFALHALASKLATVWEAFPWQATDHAHHPAMKKNNKNKHSASAVCRWKRWLVHSSAFSCLAVHCIQSLSQEHCGILFHRRAPYSHTFTPRANLSAPTHWPACFWKVRGNQRTFKLELRTLEVQYKAATLPAVPPCRFKHIQFSLKLVNTLSVLSFLFPHFDFARNQTLGNIPNNAHTFWRYSIIVQDWWHFVENFNQATTFFT